MKDVVYCASREVYRKTIRSAATIAGYLLSSAFIFCLALILDFEINAKNQIVNYMGTNFVAFAPAAYEKDGFIASGAWPIDPANESFFAEPMVVTSLLPKSLSTKISMLPEVQAVTPFLLFRFKAQDGHVFSVGGFNAGDQTALKGTATTQRDVISGVFLSPDDRGGVLVEENYALMWELETGSVVNIAGTLFPVLGIVRPGVRPVRADVYMNWPDAEQVVNKRLSEPLNEQTNLFLVRSAGLQNHEAAMEKVEKLMPSGLINTFSCYMPVAEVMGLGGKALRLVMILVLIIVMMFAANSAWASVLERRRDIAILKALGWKNSNIIKQIIAESLILATVGCVPGIIAGYAAALYLVPVISSAEQFAPLTATSIGFVALTLVLFAICGVLASLIPAVSAARTSPAELLRDNQ